MDSTDAQQQQAPSLGDDETCPDCPDCQAEPGEPCHFACSSWWATLPLDGDGDGEGEGAPRTSSQPALPRGGDQVADPSVVWADGWRTQLPGSWPYRPDEPHEHHSQGHWTRDGRLVLSCCGLDGS